MSVTVFTHVMKVGTKTCPVRTLLSVILPGRSPCVHSMLHTTHRDQKLRAVTCGNVVSVLKRIATCRMIETVT